MYDVCLQAEKAGFYPPLSETPITAFSCDKAHIKCLHFKD